MQIIANCKICDASLVGDDLNKIRDDYYCHIHKNKEEDKEINRRMKRDTRNLEKLTEPFVNLIDTDLTNWGLIEATETDNVITT